MKKFVPSIKYFFFIICALCLMGITAFIYRNTLGLTNRGPLFSDKLNRYMTLEFIPKYKASDCSVRFNVHVKNSQFEHNKAIHNAFYRYVSYNEPTAGFLYLLEMPAPTDIQKPDVGYIIRYNLTFADQCDRRIEIFQAMVAYAHDLHGNVFSIKQVPIKEPIKPVKGSLNNQKKSNSGFWIDGPDYNPDYWPTYHKAMRGDGVALYAMVELQDADEHQSRYLFMSLAETFLPQGDLKDKAHNEKEGIFKNLYPDQKERIEQVIMNWKQKIEKYQSE